MKAGEIYLAMFPFGDAPGMKLRPVLVLAGPIGPGPEALVAYISSVIPPTNLPTDLVIDPSRPEFSTTGLKVVSVLRLHKLATIHSRSFARKLGVLPTQLSNKVTERLRHLLNI